MFFCIFLDTVLFKLRLQFTMALYDLQAEHKKRWSTSSCRPRAAGGSAPSLHTGAGSLTVRFTEGNADPGSLEYYCCRGPVVASNRSRICSKVTASISPRAYLWWSISKAEGCTGGMPYLP